MGARLTSSSFAIRRVGGCGSVSYMSGWGSYSRAKNEARQPMISRIERNPICRVGGYRLVPICRVGG